MDANAKNTAGREFLQQLEALSGDRAGFETALEVFCASSQASRLTVAEGLLAIGSDYSENTFTRGFTLLMLSMIARRCEITSNKVFEEGLIAIVERPVQDRVDEVLGNLATAGRREDQWWLQQGALTALLVINKPLGLWKLDQLIEQAGNLEFTTELRVLRERFAAAG